MAAGTGIYCGIRLSLFGSLWDGHDQSFLLQKVRSTLASCSDPKTRSCQSRNPADLKKIKCNSHGCGIGPLTCIKLD